MRKRLRWKNRPQDVNVYFYGNRMKFLNTNDHSHLEINQAETKSLDSSYDINGEITFYFVKFQQIWYNCIYEKSIRQPACRKKTE